MAVKSRSTVLFQEAEDVGEHLEIGDGLLSVNGGPGVVVQQRWIVERVSQDVDGLQRITWRNGNFGSSNLSRAIGATLSPGFNVYSTSNDTLNHSLETPLYRSYHGDVFEASQYLPAVHEEIYSHLKPEKCDIDIRLEENRTVVAQWCLLPENETVTFKKEDYVDACEVGLFYLDTRDDVDVNVSGLRCKWRSDGELENCQKTTLFYKTSHVPSSGIEAPTIELETPVGLHPKVLIDLRNSSKSQNCGYYMSLQLPIDLFVDKFQSSPLFLYGEHDLELPEYKLREESWGSESLFELEAGIVNEVTLHSRYVEPVAGNESKAVTFSPLLFKACDSDDKDITENPFYSRGLGFESFFTPNTIFAAFDSPVIEVAIPRLDTGHYEATKLTTLAFLLISLMYLLSKIILKPRSRRHAAT